MKRIFLLAMLFLFFSSSTLLAVLQREMATFIGYYPSSGTDMNGGTVGGLDFYFCIREKTSKLKSIKEKLGWRVSCCGVKRKNDKFKNNKVEGASIKFITSSEFGVNEKISFDIKGLYGLGTYTRNEYTNSKEEYLATSVILEGEIFVGVRYFLTKRFGLGIDLGYSLSRDINRDRENSESFNPSGLVTMLNFIFKFRDI